MSEAKNVNYTPEQTQELVGRYTAGMPVEMIAREMSRTVRSVVAKLSREGVYQPKAKSVSSRLTKEDLVARIEAHFEMNPGTLDSLTKASRDQLILIASRF
jgi:hypothetical protein